MEKDKMGVPDLCSHKCTIFLHDFPVQELPNLLREYADLTIEEKKIPHLFEYAVLPGNEDWLCLVYPYAAKGAPAQEFYHYQNLLLWLSEKTDKAFCFAISRDPSGAVFLSLRDVQNPFGDTTIGIYGHRSFSFEAPSSGFVWGPQPKQAFDFAAFLQGEFGFDSGCFARIAETVNWAQCEIALPFES